MAGCWEKEASSSSSPIPTRSKHDAFLSFSGVDTRKNFTGHLLAALKLRGVTTFIDDTDLNRGENIGSELLKAIEESRISLVVFSKNYATSRWCLDELVKIMECRKTSQHIVVPIFYGIDPSDVRVQMGSLAEAFAKHKDGSDGKIEKWRSALTEAANLSGWVLKNIANGHEAKFIEKIVEDVGSKLDHARLHVADHPVGLESRLQKLKMLLGMESNDVRIVAIRGIGGIGKTTVAKELYNVIQSKFEGSSFLANVRETSKQPNGLVILQEQLLSDIFGKATHIKNSHQGTQVIKRRVFGRKVFLVLDDVNDVQQLKALAIDRDFFHPGSRIIITTRDMSSLNLLKVDKIYEPEALNKDESRELFSWHAFKEDHPIEDYAELSNQVVDYSRGHPLALEVLGSFLSAKSKPEWKSAMERLKKIPHDNIQGKLKISFDSLSKEEQQLFLDIACFYVGQDRNFVIEILGGCNFYPEIGFRVLADRCLIKYEEHKNQIVMHDMLRDMGRDIVRQESEKEPGGRSRLWHPEDVLRVLRDGTGTESVEGLFLNLDEPIDIQVNAKAFENMSRLRLLHFHNAHLNDVEFGFPLKHLPSNFSMENLVSLELRYSNLQRVWQGTKILNKLKFLDLSHCHELISTPDFSGLRNLEKLLLNNCISLVEVDESIQCLNKLLVLDFQDCKILKKLPSGLCKLKSLEYLNISGCSNLEQSAGFRLSPSKSWYSFLSSWTLQTKGVDSIDLSMASVQYPSCLKKLNLARRNMSQLPPEIGSLTSLTHLDISGNNLCTIPDSIGNLTRLQYFYVTDCNLSHLPSEIGRLISLIYLDLRGNNLHILPDSISSLACLESLYIRGCNVSHLPREFGSLISLTHLELGGDNLGTLPDSMRNLACLLNLYMRDLNVSHLPSEICI